jgi:SAM-dependent methyltransferase
VSASEELRAQLRYDADRSALGAELGARFVPLSPDAELETWLREVGERPHGWLTTALIGWLDGLASSYDVHGWLGAYPMHLLGARAWGELLGEQRYTSLLDVGAGAGYVTEGARPYFSRITCTETSRALRRRLQQRDFEVLDVDLSSAPLTRSFEVISCFNVLDRTARPLALLDALKAMLQPGGRLLLSLPLPLRPHVHVRGGTIAPSQRLPSAAESWERAARELSEQLLAPRGLRIERLARVPYLSRGDRHSAHYVLDAALWVCRSEGP